MLSVVVLSFDELVVVVLGVEGGVFRSGHLTVEWGGFLVVKEWEEGDSIN